MSLTQSVDYYRDEWTVERGFHRLKRGSLPVSPVFVRLPERIKGLLLLLFIALQVLTLLEFVARQELVKEQAQLAGLGQGPSQERLNRAELRRVATAILSSRDKVMTEILDEWTQAGFDKDIPIGFEKGIPVGELLMLKRQLTRRFGPVPEWAEAKLTGAKRAQLEVWGERVLDAPSLEKIFAD